MCNSSDTVGFVMFATLLSSFTMKMLMALLICLSIPSFLIYKNKGEKEKKKKT